MATETLKSFLVSIGFDVDAASQRRADQAVDATEKKATKVTQSESEKRSKLQATEAEKKAKVEAKEMKAREQGAAKEAKDRERARRAAETAEKREHIRRLGQVRELENATKKTADLMAAVTTLFAGNKAFQDIRATADSYSRLGLQSQRTGIAPSKMLGLVYGLGQMGVQKDEAEGSAEGFARALKEQPGLRNVLAGRGVRTRNANGSDVAPDEIFQNLGTYFKSLPTNVSMSQAGNLGISENTRLALMKQQELKAKIDEFGSIKGSFGLDPEKASKDGREFTAAYDKLAADLHVVHDKIVADFFKPMTAAMKSMSKLMEDNGSTTVAFGEGFVALGALLSLKVIPPILRLSMALLGLKSFSMPAWALRLLGIGGGAAAVLAAPLALHSDSGTPDATPEQRDDAKRREKAAGTFGWRDFVPKAIGGTGRAYHKGRQRFMERGGQGTAPHEDATGKVATGGYWTAEIQRRAYDRLTAGGMPSQSAIALISRWKNVESHNHGPTDLNPHSGAYGIMQGLGRRRPTSPNLDDQLDQVLQEYKTGSGDGKFVKASQALRDAKSDKDAAIGASAYERAEGYIQNGNGTDNFTGITLKGMDEVRRNVVPQKTPPMLKKPLADAPAIVPGYVPGQPRGFISGGYKALGLGADGKPVTLAPSTSSIRGDSSFNQHNTFNVNGDHRTAVAVADTVKASARRGGQDYIRFMEGSGQA